MVLMERYHEVTGHTLGGPQDVHMAWDQMIERIHADPARYLAGYRLLMVGDDHCRLPETCSDRYEIGADGCGCPITAIDLPGAECDPCPETERTEHRAGCWAIKQERSTR
jgi:hypothetical protein